MECNGTPTEDWLRQQALASLKRTFPQKHQEQTCTQDRDYRENSEQQTQQTDFPAQPFTTTIDPTIETQLVQSENEPGDQLSPQQTKEATHSPTKPPIFPDDFPTSLNSIKEYIIEKDGETFIPLHSTIVLKKRRRICHLNLVK